MQQEERFSLAMDLVVIVYAVNFDMTACLRGGRGLDFHRCDSFCGLDDVRRCQHGGSGEEGNHGALDHQGLQS